MEKKPSKPRPQQFKKGQSGNPKGRPKGTVLIPKELKLLNTKLIAETISKYFNLNASELRKEIENPETKMLDLLVLKIMYEAVKKGDHAKMNALFERVVGKVPDKVEIDHQSTDGTMSPILSDEERRQRIEQNLKKLKMLNE